ncbi:MAG: hypothetical protein JO001_22940 [Alphaproteobacteria bacterium]|nr:hypothetical protein [Alphaproteobacteria bacterium]
MSIRDWLSQSADDFVAKHVPAVAAARRAARVAAQRPRSQPLTQPVAQIATPNQPPASNRAATRSTTIGTEMDFKTAPPTREVMEILMHNTNSYVTYGGKQITAGEALKNMMRSEGIDIRQPQSGQGAATPAVHASQEAVDSLSEAQYQELKNTGGIDGVTRPNPARVTIRQGGAVEVRRSFNPETGAVEAGRQLEYDRETFFGPEGSEGWWNQVRR